MNVFRRPRTFAAIASALLFLLAGTPARAATNVDTAVPDWIEDSTDHVTCTSGSGCALSLQSWTTAWGCYSETVAGASGSGETVPYTNCQVFVTGTVAATKVPNGPCALTMIDTLKVSFVSGLFAGLGGTWRQSATFVPVTNTAVGTTKYHVVMHGGGPFESGSVGAGALHGDFDLNFPAPGMLRSSCMSAQGTLVPTSTTSGRTDGTVIHIYGDSIQ
jgi:hypothetical protein